MKQQLKPKIQQIHRYTYKQIQPKTNKQAYTYTHLTFNLTKPSFLSLFHKITVVWYFSSLFVCIVEEHWKKDTQICN